MRRRAIGLATAAVGVGVIGVSIVASAGADEADEAARPSTVAPSIVTPSTDLPAVTATSTTTPSTTAAPSTSTSTSTSTFTSTTTSPTPTPLGRDDLASFFDAWATQVSTGDVDGLVATLHPLVVDLYGRAQCVSTLSDVTGRPVEVEVRSTAEPPSNTIELDGVPLDVPGLIVVSLYRSDVDQVVDARAASFDGAIAWFTDCGSPEAP